MDHHLLAKLWDDTLAGPMPDLGRSSSSSSSSAMRFGKVQESQRSIMIMRSPIEISGNNPMSESPPVSPAGSLSPSSRKEEEIYRRHPFGGRRGMRTRRNVEAGLEAAAGDHILLLTMSDQI